MIQQDTPMKYVLKEEIKYFEDIVDRIGCAVIDVSDKAIEETANDVINIIESQSK